QVIGALSLVWVFVWLAMVRETDLPRDQRRLTRIWTVPPERRSPTRRGYHGFQRAGSETGAPPAVVHEGNQSGSESSFWEIMFSRRFLVLIVMVACINTTWQLLRAWLPKILQQGRGYGESDALYFNSLFFVATDVGCLGAGALTLWLNRRGWPV